MLAIQNQKTAWRKK